jgi:hypothetical protein
VTADRTDQAIGDGLRDLRDLEDASEDRDRPRIRELETALEDQQDLSGALRRSSLSVSDVEVAGERARQAVQDSRTELPSVDVTPLIAALRRARSGSKAKTDGGISAPVGGAPSSGQGGLSYSSYSGPAFQARLPTGGGWASPSQSEPTPGRLFRTSVRGPNGLFVIIDYTPAEPATED